MIPLLVKYIGQKTYLEHMCGPKDTIGCYNLGSVIWDNVYVIPTEQIHEKSMQNEQMNKANHQLDWIYVFMHFS